MLYSIISLEISLVLNRLGEVCVPVDVVDIHVEIPTANNDFDFDMNINDIDWNAFLTQPVFRGVLPRHSLIVPPSTTQKGANISKDQNSNATKLPLHS